jgi:hypothetical protein
MRKLFPWVAAGALLSVVGGSTFGCGDDATGPSGAGGGVVGTGGKGGSGGTGGGTDATISKSNLGRACTSDTQCGEGLTCVTEVGGSVLPGGLCTKPCAGVQDALSSDAYCAEEAPGAICVGLASGDANAYCLQGCTVGTDTSCFGREDAACEELTDGSHACIPICNADAFCTTSTHPNCSGETTWCETAPDPGTLPLGSHCDPNAAIDECAEGTCFLYDDAGNGFCSSPCRIGTVPQCGWDGTSPTAADALCLLLLDSQASNADLGYCSQLCNCDADCRYPGFVCNPLTALSQFGKAGYCFLFTGADGGTEPGIPTCPGSGGTGGTGGTGGAGGASGQSGAAGAAGAP